MLVKKHSVKKQIITLLLITTLCLPGVTSAKEDFNAMAEMVNLMDSFFGLMDSIYSMNADNEKAVLLQMHALEEIYKQQGKHKDAVSMYRRVLDSSDNPTVRNIANHRMADVLKEAGDLDAAIEVLNGALIETLKRTR